MKEKDSLDREEILELISSEKEILYRINAHGEFTFISNTVKQLLGYEPEELIGKHYEEIIHPLDFEHVSRDAVLPKLEGKKTGDENAPKLFDERRTRARKTRQLEVRLLSKDRKKELIAEVTASGYYTLPVESVDKEFCGTIGVIRDVTDKKSLEEEVQSARRTYSLRILAAGIAHDFMNLIQVSDGYLDLIKQGGISPKQETYYASSKEANRAAVSLTKKLQAISEGTFTLKTNVDIYSTAEKVFSLLPRADYIDITIDISKKKFYVYTRECDLVEILLNLAQNSFESIKEKGSKKGEYVKVSAENYTANEHDRTGLREGEYVHIIFEDSGTGIPLAFQKIAFEPWFTTKKKGHGVGLSNVDTLIRIENNGYIEIESEEEKGTTLHIYLPKGNK